MTDLSAATPPRSLMLPAGWMAEVVTYLEMRERAPARGVRPAEFALVDLGADVEAFRRLFCQVGAPWLWASKLRRRTDELAAILASPDVESFVLRRHSADIGLLQLDFRVQGACELAFFGLKRSAIGCGAGRHMMNEALDRAWGRRPRISRFWVHTCTNDHPAALEFYMRSGFVPYARGVECYPDPRLEGVLPLTAAPHIPIL